jgi:hypothetical protein
MPGDLETIFYVPLLNRNSVACGGCCPVPAEAVILPELEMVPGVRAADADWETAEVKVRHATNVQASELATLLGEISYPPERWETHAAA